LVFGAPLEGKSARRSNFKKPMNTPPAVTSAKPKPNPAAVRQRYVPDFYLRAPHVKPNHHWCPCQCRPEQPFLK
jgi:hypothetical protein